MTDCLLVQTVYFVKITLLIIRGKYSNSIQCFMNGVKYSLSSLETCRFDTETVCSHGISAQGAPSFLQRELSVSDFAFLYTIPHYKC